MRTMRREAVGRDFRKPSPYQIELIRRLHARESTHAKQDEETLNRLKLFRHFNGDFVSHPLFPVQHTTDNISFTCQISLETNKHFINASTHLMYVKLSEVGES